MEFLWPFLLIAFIGIIVALFIQLIFSWLDQKETELKNKVYFYVSEGQASILPWGETEWSKAYDGQLVLEGDELETERSSRGVLSFYNGSVVRMDAETQVNIKEIYSDEERDEIQLNLENGTLWVHVDEATEAPVRLVVYTDHLKITSYGTSFEVGLSDRESVRVLEGEALVEVLDENQDREVALEQVKVGVGQQVELTVQDYADLLAFQSVSLLEAIDDEWEESAWAQWNLQEDETPSMDFGAGTQADPDVGETDEESSTTEPEFIEEADESEEAEEDLGEAPTLTLTFPEKSPYTLPEGQTSIAITGTVSSNAATVTVTSYDAVGAAYPYALQGYTVGSTTWQYNAAEPYGNLREGRNLFTVVATTEDGMESEPLEVVVEVSVGTFEDSETEDEVESDTETEEVEAETEADPDEEEADELPTSDEPLTTPQVTSLNGDALPSRGTYTTSAESVTILGSVSASAVAVYVNDYQLSKFVAGSGAWSYYAQPDFLNYDVGENVYTVYAVDAEGNKSAVLTFTIYREAP